MPHKPTLAALAATVALGVVAATPAYSQGAFYAPQAPTFQWQIMGGYSGTSGNTANYLDGGWAVDGGFIYWPNHDEGLGIRTDLSYSSHAATDQFLAFGEQATGEEVDDGWGSFTSLSTGLVYRAPLGAWAHVYGLAQVGVTHTQLRLVQTFYTDDIYCDPFYGYCSYPDVGAASVYSYNTNHLSWNVGVGVDFPSHWAGTWFIEAQYRRVEIAPHPFEYWPIMVGLRF